jgi:predicted MPP superfamily phosphohydrolase
MRKRDIAIFFSVVLTLYGLINSYIFIRGLEAIPEPSPVRTWYVVAFWFLALAFIAGRFLERVSLSWLSSLLVWIGSFWLAAMVYLLLMVFAIDVVGFINHFFPLYPSFIDADVERTREVTALTVCIATLCIVTAGYINARTPRIKSLDLNIRKSGRQMAGIHIVAASDIHLGTIICKTRLEKIVATINSLNPDLVLLPGDVVDEDIGPVIKQNLGETLRKIQSRFGVVAVTGNHEYIGGVEEACSYLVEHGIVMLRDGVLKINDSFYVVGREDRSLRGRKSLETLLVDVDMSLPVLAMDHQPFHLEESEKNGVDLQLSGHTHHGQLWPFNFITKRIFEVSWGYKKKGGTHIYVSSGVGTWGPPVRTGNRPEILSIRLSFT